MREVRKGKLNKKVTISTTIPELISLNKSFNLMIEEMRRMISEINTTTVQLSEKGTELKQSSEKYCIIMISLLQLFML
jgi:methyl-accepting chemotaxis protein